MSDQEYISVLEHGREADSRRIAELEGELEWCRGDMRRQTQAGNILQAQIQALREALSKIQSESRDLSMRVIAAGALEVKDELQALRVPEGISAENFDSLVEVAKNALEREVKDE